MNVSEMLNESGRGGAGTLRARRWAGALVVIQLALAPVLLTGAGLMIRTLLASYQIDAGITTAGLVRVRLVLAEQAYPSPERRVQFYRQLEDRLASTPNLRAALASSSPREGAPTRDVSFDGRPDAGAGTRPVVSMLTIGYRYFETLGVSLVRGRGFVSHEGPAGETPAIVNARFVALHFPNEDPIGRRFRLTTTSAPVEGPEWVTILGVAPNVRQRDTEDRDFDPIVYVPYASNPLPFTTILVRSQSDLSLVASQVREHVRALDPDLPLFDVMTLDQLLAFNRWPQRVFGSMFSIFALIAMVTATFGLYAVTARSVAQRTHEIGVRMALGAQTKDIWWLVTRRVSIQLALGVVLGMTGAVALARLLQGVLFQVSATDPVTLIAVAALLVLVGLGASVAPANRAIRLDPVIALRHE